MRRCPPELLKILDKEALSEENELLELEISPAVWTLACDLARKARASGETLPASDILIEACARHHVIEIEHADEH